MGMPIMADCSVFSGTPAAKRVGTTMILADRKAASRSSTWPTSSSAVPSRAETESARFMPMTFRRMSQPRRSRRRGSASLANHSTESAFGALSSVMAPRNTMSGRASNGAAIGFWSIA